MTNNRLFLGFFFLLLLGSCKEEHGKDKHPDIPLFPATSNSNIVVQPIAKEIDKIFYNDSTLVYTHYGDSISFYSARTGMSHRMKSPVFVYGDGFFIVENKYGKYELLNDITLEKQEIKTIDESARYKRGKDSLRSTYTQKSDYELNQINDSLLINYFSVTYNIPKDKIPFTSDLKKGDLYVHTGQDQFIVLNVPESLDKFLNPLLQSTAKKIRPKFKRHFIPFEDGSSVKNIFEGYDYAMMSKFWVWGGGGNHYVLAIPHKVEAGYYYTNISMNRQKGKFKIMSSSDPEFNTIPTTINNQLYFVNNRQLYKVFTK
ncbi:hypothetical protein [Chryseobacterium jejuense]|uniref:Uncharacterized protein n=1 Tax=Chryseobacterium jejuense TaxID=445960 RepID=A0A2X2VIS7_CHRJE|nr:hypothetical protein [Chryseobacterium jejuense]SDJ20259.1 hypothetical protein SAMN05421542_3001 [Chryseobacterium jejuense]SQB28478.1 Uncharacterised protein [Chryseobacterium jejuense]